MSQKTILSFFKQPTAPSTAFDSKPVDVKKKPVKATDKECYDDSPVKQQKKRKRLKQLIESDEDDPNSSDESQKKMSNSSPTLANAKGCIGNHINGDLKTEPKAKKARKENSSKSSKNGNALNDASSEGQVKRKKAAQLLSDDEENNQPEVDKKVNVEDVHVMKTDKDNVSNGNNSEDNLPVCKSEAVTQNTSVEFIPKRKTARKQMRGGQQQKNSIPKEVESCSASLLPKSESALCNNSEPGDNINKNSEANYQIEKMEVECSDTEELENENSPKRKKGKKTNSIANKADNHNTKKKNESPSTNKKNKNPKRTTKRSSPKTDKKIEKSKSNVEVEAEDSESDDSVKGKLRSKLSSSEDETSSEESSEIKAEVPSSKKNQTIHPFFGPKKNDLDASNQKEGSSKKVSKDIQSSSSSGTIYNPSKNHYHPIDDACWKRSERVPYLALAKTLELIENTSARLQMIEILSNFLRSVIVLTPEDLLHSVYLCLNRLAPEYEGIELGVGDMLLMKAVAQATGRTVEKIKAEVAVKGDLGLVAESSRGNQRVMFAPPKLTVYSVFSKFKEIAKMSGNTAMSKKTDKIQALFVACRDCEAKYIIRTLSGKLRIGLAEQSVLAALSRAAVLTPPNQSYPPKVIDKSSKMSSDNFKKYLNAQTLILKTTYCECPNFDLVIPVLLKEGIEALPDHCQLCPGCPLKPMLAHPTNGIAEVLNRFDKNEFTCEYKYDGERAQIHMNENGEVKIYSRNQEDNTSKYPDVISRISKILKDSTKTFILDTEAVAWDCETKQILPFQVLSTRKKKDAVESDIVVQVCIMAFDLLYINGESLVKKTLKERRALLHSSFIESPNEFMFVNYRDGDSAETMQEFLDESVKGNCEGLMVKALTVDASYEIAKRSHNWLKLKKDYLKGIGDTLDLVVIGGYHGKGKRTGTYGGFLLACYDEDNEEFQSICKLGTGFSEEELDTHTKFFKEHVIKEPKSYYRYDSSLEPDVWFEPVQIWEIKCADLSISPVHKAALGIVDPEKGISLRFPRFLRIRDDKTKPEDCTVATQIAEMYQSQEQVQNTKSKNTKPEEDYY